MSVLNVRVYETHEKPIWGGIPVRVFTVEEVAIIKQGMVSGNPATAWRFTLDDGQAAALELSYGDIKHILAAMDGVRGRTEDIQGN